MNKFKELREWANLFLTIAGPIFIAWLIWSVNTKLDNQRLNIESKAAETYVSKQWYEADRAETNKRLDTISADISTIKIDLATMKGRNSRNN
jgi:hypothetical protein